MPCLHTVTHPREHWMKELTLDGDIRRVATVEQLIDWVRDARQRTFELVGDLTDEQLMGPHLNIVNPGLWEMGHHAWFQSFWALRHAAGESPIRDDEDALYDSMAVAHGTRWGLPLPGREDTLAYMRAVQERVLHHLETDPTDELRYHAYYSTLHEDMHTEAFTYTRQTHGYPAPRLSGIDLSGVDLAGVDRTVQQDGGDLPGDVEIPGGSFQLGSTPDEPFVFDNEKWAHTVTLEPFRIARAAVTQAEYAAFIDDGGYEEQRHWHAEGWKWRTDESVSHHMHWRHQQGGGWERRDFDRWVDLEPHRAVIHLNWYEADAYCRWGGRRLPTEAEWEAAAAAESTPAGGLSDRKRRFPWGDTPPTPERANLDWRGMGTIDVGALPEGDSAFGCRQMIGNVWEWTSTDFLPYPGFTPDPYAAYSEPWFGTRKVMRGGCWATRTRLIRTNYRNFQMPDRRDILTGFRTCAL